MLREIVLQLENPVPSAPIVCRDRQDSDSTEITGLSPLNSVQTKGKQGDKKNTSPSSSYETALLTSYEPGDKFDPSASTSLDAFRNLSSSPIQSAFSESYGVKGVFSSPDSLIKSFRASKKHSGAGISTSFNNQGLKPAISQNITFKNYYSHFEKKNRSNSGQSFSPIAKNLKPISKETYELKPEDPVDQDFGAFDIESISRNHFCENIRLNQEDTKKSSTFYNSALLHSSHLLSVTGKAWTIDSLPSKCIIAKGLDIHRVNIREFYNLMRNYGNVDFIFVHPEKRMAFLQYQFVEGAKQAMRFCSKFNARGKVIKLHYAMLQGLDTLLRGECKNPDLINLPKKFFSSNLLRSLTFNPSPDCQRFKFGFPAKANPLSRTLHVSIFFSSQRRFVETSELAALLTRLGLQLPVRMQRDQNKDNQNMWFLEWKDVIASLETLFRCHDMPFESGNLRVSFTRSNREDAF